jgi:hypothetical protein
MRGFENLEGKVSPVSAYSALEQPQPEPFGSTYLEGIVMRHHHAPGSKEAFNLVKFHNVSA